MRTLFVVLFAVFIASCSGFNEAPVSKASSLADLQPISIPDKQMAVESVDLPTLKALYEQALAVTTDPVVVKKILQRLATIDIKNSENSLLNGEATVAPFNSSIAAYERLLLDYPNHTDNDRILYQLAKAYELNGESERAVSVFERLIVKYPQSAHAIESRFRLAEHYFSSRYYKQASQHYKAVISSGPKTPYYQKSLYMNAWSLFKLDDYDLAINDYMLTIDWLIPDQRFLKSLSRADQELLNDCLRILSIIFSGLEGVESLVAFNQEKGARYYDYLLYQALANHYLSQERFKDSADTYKAFIKLNPSSVHSYDFQTKIVALYQQGSFADDVIAEKTQFIQDYHVQTEYWLHSEPDVRANINDNLKVYLTDMASYHHNFSQVLEEKASSSSLTNSEKNQHAIKSHYQQAAYFYQMFVDSFADDSRLSEQMYLLADVYYELAQYKEAINNYDRVAYQLNKHDDKARVRAVNAGFSMIVSYDALLTVEKMNLQEQGILVGDVEKSLAAIKYNKINSELLFTEHFDNDPRAVDVQMTAARELLQLGDYSRAIQAAERLSQWLPQVKTAVLIDAWLVIAQASFDTHDYVYAEAAYQQVLQRLTSDDSRRDSVTERFAASIYKQGELAVKEGSNVMAVEHYLRVVKMAPMSSIRLNAQYDAATLYLSLNDFAKATALLTDFRSRFPNHQLSQTIASKLAFAYQETGDFEPAALELMHEFERENKESEKAKLLFLAASLFEKSSNQAEAIKHYRRYAHVYKESLDLNVEAMYRLSELYESNKDFTKRRFWLKKIISADASNNSKRTDRIRYLAALSSSVLADDAYQAYVSIKLDLPLKKSFKRKKSALEKVVKRYQATSNYGVAEFVTLSSYRLAEVYSQLSRDLLSSKRPKNLDDLALEQYEILLEEQAYPFEEKAIAIHEANIQRSWQGVYDQWVKKSFTQLRRLLPARYSKTETDSSFSEGIY